MSPQPYWLLDGVAGWQARRLEGLVVTPGALSLTLEPLPGDARLLAPEEALAERLACPWGIDADPCHGLAVVDAARHRVHLFTGTPCEPITAVGGEGAEPGRFRNPRGVALLPSGGVVVADTGNGRVQVFTPAPHVVSQVWPAGDPWDVAVDARGRLHVVDRDGGRVLLAALDGAEAGRLGEGILVDPTRVAVGPDGRVAVVDRSLGAVVVFAGDAAPRVVSPPSDPRSVGFDPEGLLYVGDARGMVHVFRADEEQPTGHRLLGVAVTGVDATVVDLEWDGDRLLLVLDEETEPRRVRLWQMHRAGAHTLSGVYVTEALDSRIERCVWHRVLLGAAVPEGTRIAIDSHTSDADPSTVDVTAPDFSGWTRCATASDPDPDALVQSEPGRYLWLRLELRSNGLASPEIHRLKAFFPRQSYLQHLPAVYQEDDESRRFLDRFLSLFQTTFDGFDERIDGLWKELLEPWSARDAYLPWLASWLALVLEPEWSTETLRRRIDEAFESYALRGTIRGLERAVAERAGLDSPRILEHFRMRRWPVLSQSHPLCEELRLWSRSFYARLQLETHSQVGLFRLTSTPEPDVEPLDWGAHRFTVFFPADPHRVAETRDKVRDVVEREKPAHTEATFCPVFPRLRVGVQAALGVDARVGGIEPMVLSHLATLGYDAVLGASRAEAQARSLGTEVRPRLGLTANLQ